MTAERYSPSPLQRLRAADSAHQELVRKLLECEERWNATERTLTDRLEACIAVATLVTTFAHRSGLPPFAVDRLNDLFVGLGELFSGRHSGLLKPCPVPSNTPAASDLAQQGIAQACVEVLRLAGIGAEQARTEVARHFRKHGLNKFSTHKLRHLGTRLTGAGSRSDPAYDFYELAKETMTKDLDSTAIAGALHPDHARHAVVAVIKAASARDHRAG